MKPIRNYTEADLEEIVRIHKASGLPPECLPRFCQRDEEGKPKDAPLFFIRKVFAVGDRVALALFLRLTAEGYLFIDPGFGDAESRWAGLQRITASALSEASIKGCEDVTAWVPPHLEKTFGEKRLTALGFERSPWPSYTARLDCP
jgi:hypothetical protein